MKLILPANIYSSILIEALPENKFEVIYKEAALVLKELENEASAVAMIPTLDLINHKTLFLSPRMGLSFDGQLSNAYLYFIEGQSSISKINIRGDISMNEILLTKILFSERYSSEIELNLDPAATPDKTNNCLVAGDENFRIWNYESCISFSDQIAEMLDLPYVNFTFASKDREAIADLNKYAENLDSRIEDKLESILKKLQWPAEVKSFITQNLNSVYFEMTGNEISAVNELIRLVYYHGIIEDLFDVNFVF